uniref:Semaphorin 5B n=1 Tax=Xenopus tropicalis TaxID=8364 RepID=A0A803KBF5_XENTR
MWLPRPRALTALSLFIFHLSASQVAVETPEKDYCSRREHPILSFQELKPWLSNFTFSDVRDFSQLALDLNRNQLIVGARNYLFRLSLHNVSLIQAAEWSSDEDTQRSCQSKGKTEDECQNYVRVLIVSGKRVFTCGTNAFSPVCTSRQVGNLSKVIEKINGVARCPYDPRHNSTAVMTTRGELYAATVIDFSGRDPVIYRSLGSVPPLRTAQYNSKWLNEPNFVAAYDIGIFTYFFFRENAVEHDCGKTVYSRVARVCKNDYGGRFLLEDTWTTFMKARLNCSRPGEIPFYYNELQSTFLLPEQDLIYGVFTTNVNSIAASAVCAFNLSAITQAFNGPFRYQENPRSAWLPTINPIPNFQCGILNDDSPNENLTERSLQDAQRLFLMNDVVQPVSVEPLVTQDSVRFSKLVVDIVQGKDTLYHVMYIGTEHGTILKALSTANRSLRSCYLEEMHILPIGQQEPIRSLQILHMSGYFCPCDRLGARDPYCGWDSKKKPDRPDRANHLLNGGWTPWSSWAQCSTSCGIGFQVRQRTCSNPAPRGKGGVIMFCNENSPCPVPIFWTSWGSWTKCSSDCGGGTHSRQRSCENGNTCPGCAMEFRPCNSEPCPEVRRNTPWTPWTPVNITQGGARQEQRFRYTCRAQLADPHNLQFGRKKTETRFCPNDGSAACETDTLVDDLMRNSKTPGRTVSGGWSPWSGWSSCSRECELGFRTRKRTCSNPEPRNGGLPCAGSAMEYQDCNPQPCPVKGSWSCWSPWTQCSATCGGGHYQRTRTCTNPPPSNGGDICIGLHTEEALCNTYPCEGGWAEWSEWSMCHEDGSQYRNRYCEIHNPGPTQCLGNSTQFRDCIYNEIPGFAPPPIICPLSPPGFSLIHLIATGVSCFFGSSLLTFVIYVYCQRCQRQSQESTVIHPATPNHLHYKGSSTPKNEKYTPMEFKTLNKNNLLPDDRTNFYPLQQTNVYTTTYYPSTLSKYDFRPDSSPGRTYTNS